jgi:UDP-N-acetylmuramoyl-tripeptide--D-alanyl-D-alanine ligase
MNFNLADIARITGGRLIPADATGTFSAISTDSRTLRSGELFIPLRGENYDGHEFLTLAVRNGAVACLSEDVVSGLSVPVLVVDDCLIALGALAAAVRHSFDGAVIAVTGSSGKTTTKQMLAAILERKAPTLVTAGNFNNLIGLPLTLFRLEPDQRWAVLEMGMSARGEIARLSEIAAPTVGIITNVGPAHLETLHGIDGVARAKGELFAALPVGGCAIINADDPRVCALPVANGVRRVLYGFDPAATVRAEELSLRDGKPEFLLVLPDGSWRVQLPVAGRHNVSNALAAAAAAHVVGVAGDDIAAGLRAFQPCAGRMETHLLADKRVLIDDSYNANPLSVAAALQTLADLADGRRRIAILGDMLELGTETAALHRQTGAVVAAKADVLLALGAQRTELAAGARQAGMTADTVYTPASHAAALELLSTLLQPEDVILVKGSRGMRMEIISKALRAWMGAAAGAIREA